MISMKKQILFLFSMTTTLALLAGCGKTAAKPKTTAATTTAVPVTTTEEVFEQEVSCEYYPTYDAFSAAMAETRPQVSLFTPPQELLDTWQFVSSGTDASFYFYSFYDAATGQNIYLEIGTNRQYDDLQTFIDSVDLSYAANPFEIYQQETDYFIAYYPNDNSYTLYGIMPNTKTDYTIMLWRDDDEMDTRNDLLAVKEALGI